MKRPEACTDTFGELWIAALNALTALELRRMQPGAVISLERVRGTPHTEADQPGLKMGSNRNGNGNETENGR